MAWLIREYAHPADYPLVSELWKSAGGGVQFNRSDTEAEIQKKVSRDPDLFLVVDHEKQIIATIIAGFDGRRGMLYHLAVSPQFRKHGIASALMHEIETRLRNKGCVKAYLLINPLHPELMPFYEKLGWLKMDVIIAAKELS